MGIVVLKWAHAIVAQAWGSRTKVSRSNAACLLIWGLCVLGFARSKETRAANFSIDLDKPYSEVVPIVDEVARSGSIKGTFEYRGDEQLTGAQFSDKSPLFPLRPNPAKASTRSVPKRSHPHTSLTAMTWAPWRFVTSCRSADLI